MRLNAFKIVAVYLIISLLWFLPNREFEQLFKDKLTDEVIELLIIIRPYGSVLINALLIFKLISANNKTITGRESDYHNLYTGNPNPLWIYDQKTLKFVSVNDAAIESYGYKLEEFLAMTIKDIRPAEDREKVTESSKLVTDTHYSSGIWRHLKKDGSLIYVKISSHKINYNQAACIMVLALDTTEYLVYEQKMRQMNQVLQEEKEKLKETEKLAKVSGWEYFIKDGSLIWSDELYEIFDLDRDAETVNYSLVLKSIHQDDLSAYNLAIENLLTKGIDLDIGYRFITKKGAVKYVKVLGKMQYQNHKKFKVLGTMQDITELKMIQQENNKYKQRLKSTLNNITEGYYLINRDWIITAVNPSFVKMSGIMQENLINHHYVEVFPDSKTLKFYDQLKKVLEEELPVNFEEFDPVRKIWIYINAYPTDEGAAVYITDITENKEKDLRLKEALERYDLVAKATKDVIYDYNSEQDQLKYSNSMADLLEIPKEQIGNDIKWFKSIIHPDDADRVLGVYRQAIDQKKENYNIEYRVRTNSNSYKYVYDQNYLQYDAGHNFVRMIGAIKDIDQLKRFDDENKRLVDIITKVNNMIIIQDVNHKITWVNKAFENQTGYKLNDIIGKNPVFLQGSGSKSEQNDHRIIFDSKSNFRNFSLETINYTSAGIKYWVNAEFTPLFNAGGKFDGYITIQNNITARKEKEEKIRHQNEILKNIAWMSSHELRRPVASILGLIELINETADEEDRNKSIRMMNICARELDAIIHKINHRIEQEISEE